MGLAAMIAAELACLDLGISPKLFLNRLAGRGQFGGRGATDEETFNDWALVRQGRLSTMSAPDTFVAWMRTRYPKSKI